MTGIKKANGLLTSFYTKTASFPKNLVEVENSVMLTPSNSV